MPDVPNERRNCWTCGLRPSPSEPCEADEPIVEEVVFWFIYDSGDWDLDNALGMPARETERPCPGWTPKETSDD
jgi:hypothetical protein